MHLILSPNSTRPSDYQCFEGSYFMLAQCLVWSWSSVNTYRLWQLYSPMTSFTCQFCHSISMILLSKTNVCDSFLKITLLHPWQSVTPNCSFILINQKFLLGLFMCKFNVFRIKSLLTKIIIFRSDLWANQSYFFSYF